MKRIVLTTLALTLLSGTSALAQGGWREQLRDRAAAERAAPAQVAPAQREESRPARQERSEAPATARQPVERPQVERAQAERPRERPQAERPQDQAARQDGGQGRREGNFSRVQGQPRQAQPSQPPQAAPLRQAIERAREGQASASPPRGDRGGPAAGGSGRDGRQDGRPGGGRPDGRNDNDRNYGDRNNDGRYDGDRNYGDRNNDGRYDGRDPRQGAGGIWQRPGQTPGGRTYVRPEDRRDRDYNRPRYDERRYPRYVTPRSRYYWRGPSYRPPVGFYYQTWRWGQTLPWNWYTPNYYLNDWWNYGLPMPPAGYEWVRVGDDAILVNVFTGRIYQVVYNLFW